MYNEFGEDPGCIPLDLANIAKLLNQLEEFQNSELFKLFVEDLKLYDKALMQSVKDMLPDSRSAELVREQAIGESRCAESTTAWFGLAKDKLEGYLKQHEQQET